MKLPEKTGVSKASKFYKDSVGGPPLTKLRGGGSLADLQEDYVLFSYAPLVVYGGLSFNPIQEWINLHNHPQVVFILALDKPILNLRTNNSLDSVLWAVEKPYWESLSLHIGSMAFINRDKHVFTRVVCQCIPVVDVQSKALAPARVDIYTFSIDSNKGMYVLQPLIGENPSVIYMQPSEETTKLSKALFNYNEDPYNGVQPYPWELTNESKDTSAS